MNCIGSDLGRIGEEALEGVESQLCPGGRDKLRPEPSGYSDPDLTFPLPIEASLPYGLPVFFLSHPSAEFGTGKYGPCNYLIFYIVQ